MPPFFLPPNQHIVLPSLYSTSKYHRDILCTVLMCCMLFKYISQLLLGDQLNSLSPLKVPCRWHLATISRWLLIFRALCVKTYGSTLTCQCSFLEDMWFLYVLFSIGYLFSKWPRWSPGLLFTQLYLQCGPWVSFLTHLICGPVDSFLYCPPFGWTTFGHPNGLRLVKLCPIIKIWFLSVKSFPWSTLHNMVPHTSVS